MLKLSWAERGFLVRLVVGLCAVCGVGCVLVVPGSSRRKVRQRGWWGGSREGVGKRGRESEGEKGEER